MKTFLYFIIFTITVCIQANELQQALQLQANIQKVIHKATPAYVAIGSGAGMIISPEGFIITNNHVTTDFRYWEVYTGNGEKYRAQVIGRDVDGDLALLKINSNKTFAWIPLGNSENMSVGDRVLAFGNPFLYSTDGSPSISLGVISALHRYQDNYRDAIQTDVALNPGNSGGALLNLQGELIGVNGRIAPRFGNRRNSGVGYAITSNQIRNFLPLLKEGKRIQHATIGGIKFDERFEGQGVFLDTVTPLSHAENVGLKQGDIILAIGGIPIYNIRMFLGKLWTYPPYHKITCRILREKQAQDLVIQLYPVE